MSQPTAPSIEVDVAPSTSGRPRWLVFGSVGVGVAAVAGLAWFVLGRGGDTGGAGSPDRAVAGMVAAVDAEDYVGVLTFVAPDEVDGVDSLVGAVQGWGKKTGFSGLSAGEGMDIHVKTSDLSTVKLGSDAASVSFHVTVSEESSGDGEVAQLLGNGRSWSEDVRVITIRLGGRWYVSPMLTAGDYIVDEADLPAGDFDRVRPEPAADTVSTPKEALESLVDAVGNRDIEATADLLASGEARTVRVFRRAIDEALIRSNASWSIDDRSARVTAEGVRLDDLPVTFYDSYGESQSISYSGGCVRDSYGSSDCPLPDDSATELGITESDLVFHATRADGNVRISLVRSVSDLAAKVVQHVSREDVISWFGLEVLDDGTALPIGTDTTGTTNNYAVYQADLAAGVQYTYGTDGEPSYCWANAYSRSDGRSWSYDGLGADEARTVKLVVRCDEQSDFTIRLNAVQEVPTSFPVSVSGDLPLGGMVRYNFDVPEEGYYELLSTGDGYPYILSNLSTSAEGYYELPAGTNSISIAADDTPLSYAFELVARTPAPPEPEPVAVERGFDDGSFGMTIDLSDGPVTVGYWALTGDSVTVTATPLGSQDITVLSNSCNDCYLKDESGAGGSESQPLNVNGGGRFEITIAPYSSADQYGEVWVELSFG